MDNIDSVRPPHRTTSTNSSSTATTATSELFICFTSRLSSSSSMKISSKSILSPGRARDSSQISLSTSLSRRLRTNGSLKGGQASPMFPSTNGKKRGCGSFETPEPSSPKVTCIGQVRVKTKKQGKKMRARSKSRRGGEVSFRKTEQISSGNSISGSSNGVNIGDGSSHLHYNQFQQQPPPQECAAHRNQRWVHLPVTICEALRTFGAEFNCFLPCRSSCMARDHKEDKSTVGSNYSNNGGNGGGGGGNGSSSCGALFARWLVAEKIELVMGREEEEEEEREKDLPRRSQRRHVFDDIVIDEDVNNGKFGGKNGILNKEEEEEGRVSVCVPPKNALLLMRCRSDPVKMAALANKFWECPVTQDEEEEENGVAKEENRGLDCENDRKDEGEKLDSCQVVEEDNPVSVAKVESEEKKEEVEAEDLDLDREEKEKEIRADINGGGGDSENDEQLEEKLAMVRETESIDSVLEAIIADPEDEDETMADMAKLFAEIEDETETVRKEEGDNDNDNDDVVAAVEEKRLSVSSSNVERESEVQEQKQDLSVAAELTEEKEPAENISEREEEEASRSVERSGMEDPELNRESETSQESKERESQKDQNSLPDCLLLMMCEPKLSMEVSKETWVCSNDFIRWQPPDRKPQPPPPQPPQLPEKPSVNKTDGCNESKRRISIDSNPASHRQLLLQPPRSSCSFPVAPPMFPVHGAPPSMGPMIEQKLVGGKPASYEPFALTRCKSEPMRTAAAKLAPDACFWKNRKLEPHRPTTLGVGAAGVGF